MSLLGRGQPREAAEVRRLFTTFGYLVARQGATAVIGLIYWAVVTHLFEARDVGLAAAAASTGLLLAAFGALGVPLLLLAEIETIEAAKRRVIFTTGLAIAGAVVLDLGNRHDGTLALSWKEPEAHRRRSGDGGTLHCWGQSQPWRDSPSTIWR